MSLAAHVQVGNVDTALLTSQEYLATAKNFVCGNFRSKGWEKIWSKQFSGELKPLKKFNFAFFFDANLLFEVVMERFPVPMKKVVV